MFGIRIENLRTEIGYPFSLLNLNNKVLSENAPCSGLLGVG
jgi:hypothetical protein